MAQTFDITARLQIQGPNNIAPVVNSLRRQLGGLSSAVDIRISPAAARGVTAATASVNNLAASLSAVQAATRQVTASMKGVGLPPSSSQGVKDLNRQAAAAIRQLQAMQKATGGASSEMFKFGEQIGLAFRRFLAFQIGAVIGISRLVSSLADAAREAAEFQKTMVGLSQLGSSAAEIGGISSAISELSRNLGVSSKELSQATIYLKGAGMSANEVRSALEALAKTSLSPTFDSIRDTTEAIIAMRQQFGVGAADYEKYLGTINQVSKEFAAESEDLVTAIRRAGGAFKAASSDAQSSAKTFQQFIALFTAVRSTTRESADEISSGLRTIFGRLQSAQVVDTLKGMNVELRRTREEVALTGEGFEGEFVGGFEAVKRLHEALKDVPSTAPQYAEIVKQVGGFRQVSRVLPLIQQFPLALKAYATAQTGANSLTDDAAKAQGAFLTRLTKVREEFVGLIRDIGNDKAMQALANTFLRLAETLLKVAKFAEPVLPLLTAIAGVKIARAAYNFVIPGTQKGVTNVGGARAHAYTPSKLRAGGPVYGHGIGDRVLDMLPPGSFVVKRPSVRSAGGHDAVRSWIGGGRGSDDRRHDIPVLLEPGEHKVMPHEARRVGYGSLHRLNKTGRLPGGRRGGYASGGLIPSIPPTGSTGDADYAMVRANYEKMLSSEHASRIGSHLPQGSTFLAQGKDAVVFRRPDGDVVRIGGFGPEKYRGESRPADPDLMVQPKASARYGPHLVEHLPYAPSVRERFGERFGRPDMIQKVWRAFDRRARRRGKIAIDAHPGNVTYYKPAKGVKGRLMAIDPRTYADRPTGNEPTVDMPAMSAGLPTATRGYAEGGVILTDRGPVKISRSGKPYRLDEYALSEGRKQPMGGIGQRTRLRRVEADPVTGELSARAAWYGRHRNSRFLKHLGRTSGGVVNAVRIGTPHSMRMKSRIIGSFHAHGYAGGTDLSGLKDVPFGELAHWLQDYLDRDILKHPSYKGQRGEAREATGLKPIPQRKIPYALAENLGYQRRENEKIANRKLGNVDLSDEGQAKLAEIIGRAQAGGVDPFELAKVRQPKGRAASKAKAMRAATPPSPEVANLIESVSELDDLEAIKESYRSDKDIIRTGSPLSEKVLRDKMSAGEKREAYAQRKDQYGYLKDAYKKRIAELKARGDQYNRPVKSSVLVTGENLPSLRQTGIADPSRVTNRDIGRRIGVISKAEVSSDENSPPSSQDMPDPVVAAAFEQKTGARRGATAHLTEKEAADLAENYGKTSRSTPTAKLSTNIRIKGRSAASTTTAAAANRPDLSEDYRRRQEEQARKYAELQKEAAAAREKIGLKGPIDINRVQQVAENAADNQQRAFQQQESHRRYTPEEWRIGQRSAASRQTPNISPVPLIVQHIQSQHQAGERGDIPGGPPAAPPTNGPGNRYPLPAIINERADSGISSPYPGIVPRPDVARTPEGAIPLPGPTPAVSQFGHRDERVPLTPNVRRTVRFGTGNMPRGSLERSILIRKVMQRQLQQRVERSGTRAARQATAPTAQVHEISTPGAVAATADVSAAPPAAVAAKTIAAPARAARSAAAGAGGNRPPRQPRTRAGGAEPPGGDNTNREILAVLKSLLAETKGVRSSAKSTAADTKKAAGKTGGKRPDLAAEVKSIREMGTGRPTTGRLSRAESETIRRKYGLTKSRASFAMATRYDIPQVAETPGRILAMQAANNARQAAIAPGLYVPKRLPRGVQREVDAIRTIGQRPAQDVGISRQTTREEFEQQRRAGRRLRSEREGKRVLGIAGGYRPTAAERQAANVAAAATPPAPPAAGRIAALAADRAGLRERRRSPVPTPGFTGSERTAGGAPAQPLGRRVKDYVDARVAKQGPMTPEAEAEFRKRTQRQALRELQGTDVLAERQRVGGTTARSGRQRLRQILDVGDQKPSLMSRIFGRVDAGGSLARVRGAARRGGGRVGRFMDRVGGHAGNLGFFASAFAPQIVEKSYGTVDQPKGSVEQAKYGQAAGGALTFGGVGAQVGSTFGAPGAAVGLAAGAVYGFYTSLQEAKNRIEEIKFDKTFHSLQASLDSIAAGNEKLSDATNQVVSNLLATAGKEANRRVDVEGAGKNTFQRAFESIGGDPHKYDVFGLYTKSTEQAERDIGTQRQAKRAEILTPQLPQLQQIGERIASEVRLGSHQVTLPEGADQATIAGRRESRIKSFQDAGGSQIAETIAEIQHIPLRQVYENFDRIAVSANRLRIQQEGQEKVVAAATIEMTRFQEVGDAVRGAADSLHGLQAVSSGLASVFEGQVATAKVGGFSGAAANVGGLDREAFQRSVSFTTGQVGGASIGKFGGVITDIDRAMRELPGAIAHAPLNLGDADALKGGLTRVFAGGEGGVGGLNLPREMQSRLSDAVEAMDPERLAKEVKGNPGKLAEELIRESFGDLPRVFADITKQVEERGGQFAEGLAAYSQMLQKAGESRDLEGRAQLGVTQARAALAGSRQGRAPEDLVTLREMQEPIRQRQERLAGGDAFNPEAIGGRLATARRDVVAIQGRINNVQNEPADPNNPTKRQNTLNDLVKDFDKASLEASNLQRALEHLADASDRSAVIQEKLNQVEKQRQGQLSYTEKLLTADPRQLFEMQRGAQAADVAVGQGGFEGFSAENIQRVLEHLRSLENVKLPGYGNRTGGQVAENLIGGANRQVFGDQAAGLERDRDNLLQQQVKIAQDAASAQKQLSDHFASTAHSFLDNLEGQNRQFLAKMDTLIHEARLRDVRGVEERAAVAAERKIQTVGKVENLQNLIGTDLPTIKKITSAPEFATYRESSQRIKAIQQARAKLLGDRGDNGELGQEAARNPGFAFGRQFHRITRGDPDSQGAADRLREELYASASSISSRTGGALTHEDVVRQVIPLVMDKVQEFQKNRNPNSAKSLNVPGALRNAIGQSLKVVQGAEEERFRSAERATGIHAFNVEEGTKGAAQETLKRVSENFDEIIQSIGEVPKNIRDLGQACREAFDTINKAREAKKTREDVEKSKPQVAQAKASGGTVFRRRGTDTVPAMLTPGEFVVNAASTRKHLPLLRNINAGAKYYAEGGMAYDDEWTPERIGALEGGASGLRARLDRLYGEDAMKQYATTPTPTAEVQAPAKIVGEEPRRSPTPESSPTPPTPKLPTLAEAIAGIPSANIPATQAVPSVKEQEEKAGRNLIGDAIRNNPKISDAIKNRMAAAESAGLAREAQSKDVLLPALARSPSIVIPYIAPGRRRSRTAPPGRMLGEYLGNLTRNINLANQQSTPFSKTAVANAAMAHSNLERRVKEYSNRGMPRHAKRAFDVLSSFNQSKIAPEIDRLRAENIVKGASKPIGKNRKRADRLAGLAEARTAMFGPEMSSKLTRSQHRKMQEQVFGPEMSNRWMGNTYGFAGGGMVPSMVSPGEFVVDARSARGNAGILGQINAGTAEYHQAGGIVGGAGGGVAVPGIHLSPGVKSTLDGFTSRFSDAVSGMGGSLGRLSASASSLAGSLGGFNDAASSLARALANASIPSKIEVSSRNEVVVTLNGGAVIAAIKGDTAAAVMEAIQQQLPEQVRKIVDSLPPRA